MADQHTVSLENATKFAAWIATRGGIAIWKSINLTNPGASWSTPALTEDGQPYPKPTWQAESAPSKIVTNPAEVTVHQAPKEVKRFHVALKQGDGFSVTLTTGSSRRVEAAVHKAGENAWYEFDYSTQEAVILVPDKSISLDEWIKEGHNG